MRHRLAPPLVAGALATAVLAIAPVASSGAPAQQPPPPDNCGWHGLKIVKRVNVGCPKAQKVLASYYGVNYPEFKGWSCLNDPPNYSGGHCWKNKKKFKYKAPSY
jgi:hypothetical protein